MDSAPEPSSPPAAPGRPRGRWAVGGLAVLAMASLVVFVVLGGSPSDEGQGPATVQPTSAETSDAAVPRFTVVTTVKMAEVWDIDLVIDGQLYQSPALIQTPAGRLAILVPTGPYKGEYSCEPNFERLFCIVALRKAQDEHTVRRRNDLDEGLGDMDAGDAPGPP